MTPESIPVVSDFFKLVDQRFGRFWGTLLLLVTYVFIMSAALKAVWDWIGSPLAGLLISLFGGRFITLDNLTSVLSTAIAGAVLAGTAAIIIPLVGNLTRRRVPQAAIDSLAELRSEGISILNDVPKDKDDVARWQKRWTEWKGRVVAELKRNFTKAEMLSFDRLGVIEEARFGFAVTPEHGHCLMMLNKQLTILENMIQRHQERR